MCAHESSQNYVFIFRILTIRFFPVLNVVWKQDWNSYKFHMNIKLIYSIYIEPISNRYLIGRRKRCIIGGPRQIVRVTFARQAGVGVGAPQQISRACSHLIRIGLATTILRRRCRHFNDETPRDQHPTNPSSSSRSKSSRCWGREAADEQGSSWRAGRDVATVQLNKHRAPAT